MKKSSFALALFYLFSSLCPRPGFVAAQNLLAPRSFATELITYPAGKGVSRSALLKALDLNREKANWSTFDTREYPSEDSFDLLLWKHFQHLQNKLQQTIPSRMRDKSSMSLKNFNDLLYRYIRALDPQRFELMEDKAFQQMVNELLQNLLSDIEIKIVHSDRRPGILPDRPAVDPGISLDKKSLEDPNGYLVETVVNYLISDKNKERPLLIRGNLVLQGGIPLGTLARGYFVFHGKREWPFLKKTKTATAYEENEVPFTLVPMKSEDPSVHWERRGMDELIFIEEEELGTYDKTVYTEDKLSANGKKHSVNLYYTAKDKSSVKIAFSTADAWSHEDEITGTFNNQKVYYVTATKQPSDYPKIEVRGTKVILQKVVQREKLASNVLVVQPTLKEPQPLRVYSYLPILYHGSGVIEWQQQIGIEVENIASRLIHGALEAKLETLAYQGTANSELDIYKATHEMASALDEFLDGICGEDLERLCETQKKYFDLSSRYQAHNTPPKSKPLNRIAVTLQELPQAAETLLEQYCNLNGLGLTRNKFSEEFKKYFYLDPQTFPKNYSSESLISKTLEGLYSEDNYRICRIKVGQSKFGEGGEYYYFSFTGYADFPFASHSFLQKFFTLLEDKENKYARYSQLPGLIGSSQCSSSLKRFVSHILTLRMKRLNEYYAYETFPEYFTGLSQTLAALKEDPFWKEMDRVSMPAEIATPYFFLLKEKTNNERQREKLFGAILERYKNEKAIASDPSAVYDRTFRWKENSLPCLIEATQNADEAKKTLRYLNQAKDIAPSVLAHTFREKESRIARLQELSDGEMDREFLALYEKVGFDYLPGIRFMIEVASEDGPIAETAMAELGKLFEKSSFLKWGGEKRENLKNLRDECIEALIPQVFSSSGRIRTKATEALTKMDVPRLILRPLHQYCVQASRRQVIPKRFYGFFQQQVERCAEELSKREAAEKSKPPKPRKFLSSVEALEIEIRRKIQNGSGRVSLKGLTINLMEEFSFLFGVADIEQAIVKVFLGECQKESGIQQKQPDTKPKCVMALEDEKLLKSFLKYFCKELRGIHEMHDLANFAARYVELPVEKKTASPFDVIYNLIQKNTEYKTGPAMGGEYFFSLPCYDRKLPADLVRNAAILTDESFQLEEREKALKSLRQSFQTEMNFLETGGLVNTAKLAFLLSVAEVGLGSNEEKLRLGCGEMILRAYEYFDADKKKELDTLSVESKVTFDNLYREKMMGDFISENPDVFFAILGLCHPRTPKFSKNQLIAYMQTKMSSSARSKEIILKVLIDHLLDPDLADAVLNALKSAKDSDALEIYEMLSRPAGVAALQQLIQRGIPSQLKALLELHDQVKLNDKVHIFKGLKSAGLAPLLLGSALPNSMVQRLMHAVYRGTEQDVDAVLSLLESFPTPEANLEYQNFVMRKIVDSTYPDRIVSVAIEKLLDGDPTYPVLVQLLLKLFSRQEEKVAASRLNPMENFDGNPVLMSSNLVQKSVHGSADRLIQIAQWRGVPTKLYLQANLYHELIHHFLFTPEGTSLKRTFVENLQRRRNNTARLAWTDAQAYILLDFGYCDEDMSEELFVKLLELIFVGNDLHMAGIENSNFVDQIEIINPDLIKFIKRAQAQLGDLYPLPKKGESRKQLLIRLTKKLGVEIDLAGSPETDCAPTPSIIESSV